MAGTLHMFFSLLWKRKSWLFAYTPIFIAALACIQLQPFFYKFIVDAAELGNVEGIQFWVFWYVCFLAIGHGLENIEHYLLGLYMGKIQDDMVQKTMNTLRNMDHHFHTSKSSGGLISLVKRGDSALYGFGWTILNKIAGVAVQTMTALVTFWIILPSAFFILIITIFVLGIVLYPILKRNMKTRRALGKREDALSASIVDNLIAFENIKIFGQEEYEDKKTSSLLRKRYVAGRNYLYTFQEINFVFVGIMSIAIALIIYLSMGDVSAGALSTGTLILIITFLTKNFYSLWEVIYNLRDLLKSYTDIDSYFRILNLTPAVQEANNANTVKKIHGRVHIDNVSFRYAHEMPMVLQDINLDIAPGKTLALVGTSGGGKSTLAKLILRFYDPTSGHITIDDTPLQSFDFASLRQHVGIIPQEPLLFNNSLAYNISYPKQNISQKEIEEAARKACLHDFIDTLPEGYGTIVGERGIKLSGGQRQRLAIARAFIHNPTIIIFDEATSQLDSENEHLITLAMNELRENKTMIIIAHRLSTIMHADNIAVFEGGKIVELASHAELLERDSGSYARLWNMQTNGLII